LSGRKVIVRVPATSSNLGPGFDCLGLALGLYNFVEMKVVPEGSEVTVQGEGASEIPTDESNLTLRAARRVFDLNRAHPAGLSLRLTNNIPPARGLGSSAAAVVGGLVAANALSGSRLSSSELLNLAGEMDGHLDNVAPALLGGLTVVVPDGTAALGLRLEPPAGLLAVAAVPAVNVYTSRARAVLPREVPFADAVFNLGRVALLVGALTEGRFEFLASAMADRLHQKYREHLVPGLTGVIGAALKAGALGAALSGSGPTVIALTNDPEKAVPIAAGMREALGKLGLSAWTPTLVPDREGACTVETADGGAICS